MISCSSPSHVDSSSEHEINDSINQNADDLQTSFDEIIETGSTVFATYPKFTLVKANQILFDHIPDCLNSESQRQLKEVIKIINDNFLEYDGCFFDLSSLLSSGDYLYYYAGGKLNESDVSTYLGNMYREVLKNEYDWHFNLRQLVNAAGFGDKGAQKKLSGMEYYNLQEMRKVVPDQFGVLGYDPYDERIIFAIFYPEAFLYELPFNDFKLFVPFANNLLEEYLFNISNGSISLVNLENNSLAKKFLKSAYAREYEKIKFLSQEVSL